ncbi:FKBP-type peptidyl-prolyl cis-trans isomerase [Bacteriovorax sp. DB6_IX]|uniref:FKBP-type peptidyl-prolyl cis-trans isomerase n=1 Tax=Bacteriovorax sp. DB6_IX TaxID=1353530 RepID=UPI00038A036F|nr:FKBP-type peptidyl-prolyl cis-trans isomerase [Bacteriovorax sp. DB6_IX]EQC50966.1 putative outer membrane protein MIP [Bacteriovorax sp. DB6_IX]
MSIDWKKVSYILGQQIGSDLKNQGIQADVETFCSSLKSAFNGEPSEMGQEEIQQVMTGFQSFMQEKQMEMLKAEAEKNLVEGQAFLESNKAQDGIQTLPSGLQYRVLTEGEGNKPSAEDTIEAHYEGRLIDGTVFDSSYQRGTPATFPVNRVIAGWTEALQLMGTGSKWQLFIPANLAYGEQGAPPAITPNATLIFDVELLAIK